MTISVGMRVKGGGGESRVYLGKAGNGLSADNRGLDLSGGIGGSGNRDELRGETLIGLFRFGVSVLGGGEGLIFG